MTSIRQILLTGAALFSAALLPAQDPKPPQAHFHHVHLNVTNPKAAADFYTTKFDAEKTRFAGVMDAVRTQKSWLLFTKVDSPPPSEIVSTIWHIGWGAEDMPAAYKQQLESGTKFETPLTDISALAGLSPGKFYYAYVDGPEHALIELNTASHHRFGHLHLLSEDPVAAAEWYQKHLGIPVRGKSAKARVYEGYPVGPSASLQADNVNIIIFPVGYAHTAWPTLWDGRKSFESTKGRAIDHIGFSVDHLQEWLERLRADGVKVTAEPRTVADGKIKFAFIEGPDHILIELVEGSPDQQ
jgi:catechol 2,3-dioxygenase-like lactoylglutathione lyase family enzyme